MKYTMLFAALWWSYCLAAQTLYNFVAGSGSWTDPTSWSPIRVSPKPDDMLQFNADAIVTGIPVSESIGSVSILNRAQVRISASSSANLQVGNIYPLKYAQGFYEGMAAEGQQNIVNLLRCAWAGSQRYGALVWSGDIDSSFESLRNQLAAGLNMGLAGIPWWTTDIGGFHGGVNSDPVRYCLMISIASARSSAVKSIRSSS